MLGNRTHRLGMVEVARIPPRSTLSKQISLFRQIHRPESRQEKPTDSSSVYGNLQYLTGPLILFSSLFLEGHPKLWGSQGSRQVKRSQLRNLNFSQPCDEGCTWTSPHWKSESTDAYILLTTLMNIVLPHQPRPLSLWPFIIKRSEAR